MAVAIAQTAHPTSIASTSGVQSYADLAIGTASAGRVVAVCITKEVSSAAPTGVTIGGITATLADGTTFGNSGAWIYYASVPTGTTATIVINWSASFAADLSQITVYEITGADSVEASSNNDTSTDMDSGSPLTAAITIPTSGGALAVAAGSTGTNAKAWGNITEDRDDAIGLFRHTTAISTTPGSVSITCTGTSNGEDGSLAVVVFGPAPQAITGGLYTDTDTFGVNEVVQLDIFYTHAVEHAVTNQDIDGALYDDTDAFFTSVLTTGAVNIGGALYADTDAFQTAVLTTGAVNIDGGLYAETDTFQTAVVADDSQTITGALFSDSDSFGVHEVVQLDIFYTHLVEVGDGTQEITGALYDDTDAFQTATVAHNDQTITGSLYAEADTFYSGEVVQLDIFYTHVASATFPATGDWHDDEDTFYSNIVARDSDDQAIEGSLFSDGDVFATSDVIELDDFYGAAVTTTYAITGALYDDADAFHGSGVDLAPSQTILAVHYDDTDAFQTAALTVGEVTITGALYSDAESFYTATLEANDQSVTGSHYDDTDTFYSAFIGTTLRINATLYDDTDTFYGPRVRRSSDDSPFYGGVGHYQYELANLRKKKKKEEEELLERIEAVAEILAEPVKRPKETLDRVAGLLDIQPEFPVVEQWNDLQERIEELAGMRQKVRAAELRLQAGQLHAQAAAIREELEQEEEDEAVALLLALA